MVRLLIDLDVVMYLGLYSGAEGYFPVSRACDNKVSNIIEYFDTDYKLFLSGDNNFRKGICSTYKSGRPPKPPYYYEIRNYFIKYWDADVTDGQEADDSIAQSITDGCIICSNDHDFRQLGVTMFDPKKWELKHYGDGTFWFWLQMLTGCTTDKVEGLTNPAKLHHKNPPKFTDATAGEVLRDKSPEQMKQTVIDLYKQIYDEDWFSKFDTTARLIYLRRKDAREYYQKF